MINSNILLLYTKKTSPQDICDYIMITMITIFQYSNNRSIHARKQIRIYISHPFSHSNYTQSNHHRIHLRSPLAFALFFLSKLPIMLAQAIVI